MSYDCFIYVIIIALLYNLLKKCVFLFDEKMSRENCQSSKKKLLKYIKIF